MGSILWSLSLVSVGFWVCIFSGQFLYGRRRLVGVGMRVLYRFAVGRRWYFALGVLVVTVQTNRLDERLPG